MDVNPEQVWSAAREKLRGMIDQDIFELWFSQLRATGMAADCLTLEVANEFYGMWLKDNYLDLIQDILAQAAGEPVQVRFVVAEPATDPAVLSKRRVTSEPVLDKHGMLRAQGFNPRNTFETFVVGSNNTFAHAAALAVAQAPGKSYNPLFVYSGVGLGKTHLLHAIGQHVVGDRKAARVTYVTTEKFTNEFIDAIQNNQLVRFRRRYRQADVFLIDDIHFLAGKERIQEEFFHTFNALHDAHKQIVMTCDRPVNELQSLEQRLVSRFEWGLVVDMQAPDVETRLAILRKKEKVLGLTLPAEVMNFLANRIRTNVRRLEGALVRVGSYGALTGQPITVDLVEELLREVLHEEGRHAITIDLIQKRVAAHFDLRLSDMSSRRRPENIAFPRQIAMYLARQFTENSLTTIGEAFGGRDHGTVLHACRLVKDRMQIDSNVRQVVAHLEKQLLR